MTPRLPVLSPRWLSTLAPHYYEYKSQMQDADVPADKRAKRLEEESEAYRRLIRREEPKAARGF
jgi:hypothetical protein